jgi:hypothetical protein
MNRQYKKILEGFMASSCLSEFSQDRLKYNHLINDYFKEKDLSSLIKCFDSTFSFLVDENAKNETETLILVQLFAQQLIKLVRPHLNESTLCIFFFEET